MVGTSVSSNANVALVSSDYYPPPYYCLAWLLLGHCLSLITITDYVVVKSTDIIEQLIIKIISMLITVVILIVMVKMYVLAVKNVQTNIQ